MSRGYPLLVRRACLLPLILASFLFPAGRCLAIVPDFQQADLASLVIVKSDGFAGTGTIVNAEPLKPGVIQLWILTADHVVHTGGTRGKLRPNLRIITNSLAGGKSFTLPVDTNHVLAGGESRTADLAFFAVNYEPGKDGIDFAKYTATLGAYTGRLNDTKNYATEWGYGYTGKPDFEGKLWNGYERSDDDSKLRFQNNVFSEKGRTKPDETTGDDNYLYDSIKWKLDSYDPKTANWVNGEGASYEGDSGGPYFTSASATGTFPLKTGNNPQALYNGPPDEICEGTVTIPYNTDVMVAIHTRGSKTKYRVFNTSTGTAYPLSSADIKWMQQLCVCTLKVSGGKLLPQPFAKRPPGTEDTVLFLAFVLLSCSAGIVTLRTTFGARSK